MLIVLKNKQSIEEIYFESIRLNYFENDDILIDELNGKEKNELELLRINNNDFLDDIINLQSTNWCLFKINSQTAGLVMENINKFKQLEMIVLNGKMSGERVHYN